MALVVYAPASTTIVEDLPSDAPPNGKLVTGAFAAPTSCDWGGIDCRRPGPGEGERGGYEGAPAGAPRLVEYGGWIIRTSELTDGQGPLRRVLKGVKRLSRCRALERELGYTR